MLLFVEYLTVCIYDARICEVAMGLKDLWSLLLFPCATAYAKEDF